MQIRLAAIILILLVAAFSFHESLGLNFDLVRQKYLSQISATELDNIVKNSTEFQKETQGRHYDFPSAIGRLGYNQSNSYLIKSIEMVYGLSDYKTNGFKTLVVTLGPDLKVRQLAEYDPWHAPPGIPILLSHPQILLPANYTIYMEINKTVWFLPPSPLEQLEHGVVANDIDCDGGISNVVLVFKEEDRSPACVQYNTATSLMQRGWAVPWSSESIVGTNGTMQVGKENATTIARVPLYISIKNFQPLSPPLIIRVSYPNGTIYKTDEISSTKISPDGIYVYNLVIESPSAHDVLGKHRIFLYHEENVGEEDVTIQPQTK